MLLEHYQFRFAGGYPRVLGLDFEDKTYIGERCTKIEVPAASLINRSLLERFASEEVWFKIAGFIHIPGVDVSLDIELLLIPTGDSAHPVSVVFMLERELYTHVYGDVEDIFDPSAASILFAFSTHLGAHPLVDSFNCSVVWDLSEVATFDSAGLLDGVLNMGQQRRVSPGFVFGVRTFPPEIRQQLKTEITDTLGFSVCNHLLNWNERFSILTR